MFLNNHPFGMIQPERTWESDKYRYGFNSMEKDDEVKGVGNSLDFGARIYDPRVGRWLSLDPLAKKYPEDSPYIFSGDSPIALKDQDGKEKVYTLKMIAKNGSVTKIQIVEKYNVKIQTIYTRESIGYGSVTFFTSPYISNTKTFDKAQEVVWDMATNTVYYGPTTYPKERSNIAFVRAVEDNYSEAANYLDNITNGGGGIVFVSSLGQGQENRKGYNADTQSENIDLLLNVIGAATSAAANKEAVGFLESFKQGIEGATVVMDSYQAVIEQFKSPTESPKERYCPDCNTTFNENNEVIFGNDAPKDTIGPLDH
jgi:RHS repeat-associated protein